MAFFEAACRLEPDVPSASPDHERTDARRPRVGLSDVRK